MGQPAPNEITLQAMKEADAITEPRFATADELITDLDKNTSQVGCEGEDGLLRVHPEATTCDVCEPILAEKLRRQQLVAEAVADGRKLVTVRQITAIDDIPGADLIKKATVEGWPVVVKAGEFQVGDYCVFFEVDSYLPMDDERYRFLEKNAINWEGIPGARLKTIRLRKQLSQGLALPVSAFPEVQPFLNEPDLRDMNFTGVLGIMKWDKPVNAQLAGMAKGNFPSFLRKSDQERCQNMVGRIFGYDETFRPVPNEVAVAMMHGAISEAINAGRMRMVDDVLCFVHEPQASRDTRYEVTLKMDGSSMTVYRRGSGDELQEGVCSRNLDLKMEGNDDNAFVKMAKSGILQVLGETATNVALQGELMGPGIQGNRENFAHDRFFVYNVFDIEAGEFMSPAERRAFVAEMNSVARELKHQGELDHEVVIEHVPTLHYNVTLEELGIRGIDDLLQFAIGPSMNNNVREGLVFKAMDGSHQFKAISNLYLEQEK